MSAIIIKVPKKRRKPHEISGIVRVGVTAHQALYDLSVKYHIDVSKLAAAILLQTIPMIEIEEADIYE